MNPSAQSSTRSIDMLKDELLRRGYSASDEHFPNRYIRFTAPNGNAWLTHKGMVTYPFVSKIATQICKQKPTAQVFAKYNGLNVPRTLQLPLEVAETDVFLSSYAPLVVKPHDSYGSHGLTMDVRSSAGLAKAITDAKKHSPSVLVQQQFAGSEVRFTILNGQVVSCILRETPRVIGDGTSTIKQLVDAENQVRLGLTTGVLPYPQLTEALLKTDMVHSVRIPETGEMVKLGSSSLVSGGASLYDVTDQVDESYKATALRMAMILNPDFLITDLLIADYRIPQTADNYVFLECNTSPSLRLYYGIRGVGGYDIVFGLADLIDVATGNEPPAGYREVV